MKFVMRADASPEIGTGHVRRCLAVAEALRERGATVHFVTRPHAEYSARLFENTNFPVIALADRRRPEWGALAWEVDAAATGAAIAELGVRPDWLIVDHYGLDERWEQSVRPHVARILVMDDLANRAHDADALLDPNMSENQDRRYCGKVSDRCLMLLGPRHAPLRDEFRRARASSAARTGPVTRILVSCGGGPLAASCTLSAIQALADQRMQNTTVDVVFNAEVRELQLIAAACSQHSFAFHHATDRMGELMSVAGLGIGAGGTSLWERCCVGLPCLTFALAENQRQQVIDAASAGILLAPDTRYDDPASLGRQVRACLENPSLLTAISRRAMSVVDGRGTVRLMRALGMHSVRVRKAASADCRPIFEWRIDPAVRQASRNTAPIDFSAHETWFESALADPRRLLLVGEAAGKAVGVVRFDVGGNTAEVSIYLAAAQIGCGLGVDLLLAAEAWLAAARPDVKFVAAEVLAKNERSNRLFASAGYLLRDATYAKDLE